MERVLDAYINDQMIGRLSDENGIWSFTYSATWVKQDGAYALSPHLPLTSGKLTDGSSLRQVQWYFDNLLPEEGQRLLLAKDAKLDKADAFGLLAYYGAESAGSITLLAPGEAVKLTGQMRPLDDNSLSGRIRNLPDVPLTNSALKRMSLAGAQHKLAVVLDHDNLFEPEGNQPSTHILKPDHPDKDYAHSVINEWFTMRLARAMNLIVPDVHRRYVPEPVYLIDRFDRKLVNGTWHRLHAIDACQLLGLDRAYKYRQGSIGTLGEIANVCRSTVQTRTRLFNWLLFNVLVGNSDAHLKNLSFIVSSDGIELSPHYDLLSIGAYDMPAYGKQNWPDRTLLAWPILDANYFSDVKKGVMIDAAAVLQITKPTAERLIENMRSQIKLKAGALMENIQAENEAIVNLRPEIRMFMGGEERCVRTIFFGVIADMVRQLG